MDNLFISQIVSLQAPQLEVDKVAKGQSQAQSAQAASDGVFLAALQHSMKAVNETVNTEKEDPLEREEEDDNQDSES